MTDLATVDYFSDHAISQDPYEYWDHMREQGPVFREPVHGVVAVTGYEETLAAFKDHDSFSAVNAIGGPFPPLPFEPEGDDITEQIAMVDAVRRSARERMLVLLVDGLDHTDDGSAAFLLGLALGMADAKLMIVGALLRDRARERSAERVHQVRRHAE